jgi:hypothetical protein
MSPSPAEKKRRARTRLLKLWLIAKKEELLAFSQPIRKRRGAEFRERDNALLTPLTHHPNRALT